MKGKRHKNKKKINGGKTEIKSKFKKNQTPKGN